MCVPFILHDYHDSFWFAKKWRCLLKITLFLTNSIKGITSISRTSIETIFSPHTILRDARPRSQERARTRVRICPGVPHEQCYSHPDHVAQEISTDRRKPEHGLVPSSSNGEYTFVPGTRRRPTARLYREWGTASASFGIRCAHRSRHFDFRV